MEAPNEKPNKLIVTDENLSEVSLHSVASNDSTKTTESLEREKRLLGEEKDEYYIPLVAKDSEWADIAYHHPKWKIPRVKIKGAATNLTSDSHDSIDTNSSTEPESGSFIENEEIEVTSINPNDDLPIYALFPSLRTQYPHAESLLERHVSTTAIAKSLVGEKPNFSVMKTSGKLQPTQTPLTSIEEIIHEVEPDSSIQIISPVKGNRKWPPIIENKELADENESEKEIPNAKPLRVPPNAQNGETKKLTAKNKSQNG